MYVAASVGCAMASDFGQLLMFRVMQGVSAGAGMVVGRAIIRDSFEGHEAQRLMSLVTMIFGLAPAIAPVVGGWLQSWFGWQAVFLFLALYGLVLLAVCWVRLPETHPPSSRHPFAVGPLARTYLKLTRSPRLLLLCFSVGLNFAGFFLYAVIGVYRRVSAFIGGFIWFFSVPSATSVAKGFVLYHLRA